MDSNGFKNLPTLLKGLVLVIAVAIALLLILAPRACQAQPTGFPTPSATQFWQYQYGVVSDSLRVVQRERQASIDSLERANGRIVRLGRYADSLIAVGGRLVAAKQQRIDQLLATGNDELAALNTQLAQRTAERDTARAELNAWKPRTQAGLLLRKTRNVLAVAGGVAVLVVGVKLAVP